jgi:hypothetical protein
VAGRAHLRLRLIGPSASRKLIEGWRRRQRSPGRTSRPAARGHKSHLRRLPRPDGDSTRRA